VLALDPDTGKLKWHYQFTPHDLHDWDATQNPVLVDTDFLGQPRKVLAWPNRNGFFYLVDRTNGKFLSAKAFVKQTWNDGFDYENNGRPKVLPGTDPTPEGNDKVWPVSTAARTGCRTATAR
jgi:alcohol dehydrogenase (cytochrome c)